MWIKRIAFKNFGPHRNLDLGFQRGLVGLFGLNGKGKSHVVDGIYACLTNDFGRFAGVKLDCIRDTSDPTEESSLTVWGEHNDVEFEVFRRLRKAEADKRKKGLRSDNELVVGGKTFTKDPEIRAELEQRLGVNFKLIGTHVFVAQREMFRFISDTAGERAGTFQTLCGTEKAQRIVTAIESLLDSDRDLLVEVEDNSDEINTRISRREVDLESALAELADAKGKLVAKKRRVDSKTIIEKHKTWRRAVDAISKLNPTIKERRKTHELTNRTAAEKEQLLQDVELAVAEMKPVAEEAKATLKRLETYTQMKAEVDRLTKQVAECKAAVSAFGKRPSLHPENINREKLVEERGSLRAKYQENMAILNTFEVEGVVKCPTCGTSVKELDKHLKQLRDDQPNLKDKGLQLKGLIELIDACRTARNDYDVKKDRAEQELKRKEAVLAAAKLGDPPSGVDKKRLQETVETFAGLEEKRDDARKPAQDAVSSRDIAATRLDADVQRRKDLRAERDANIVDAEELKKAKKRLKRHHAARVLVAAVEQKVSGYMQAQAQDRDELDKLKARLARNKKAHQFAAKLKEIAGVMHRQALPQMVAQSNLQDMEGDINKILDMFGNPFWIETAEDLTFTVHFPGEPARSAQRLSVGQKGVLAMAFRPAVCALFDAEIGMMSLDEPTADMDERNRGYMATALAQYAAQVRGRRQVIVITHAQELKPAFDQVINLEDYTQ